MKGRWWLTHGAAVAVTVAVILYGHDAIVGDRARLPSPTLTPGDVLTTEVSIICASGYAASVRNVSTATANAVLAEYGYYRRPPDIEIDHLVPLELGGSNDIKNLWPEPGSPRPGYREKDRVENAAHRAVCSGRMTVAHAQVAIAKDWVALGRELKVR